MFRRCQKCCCMNNDNTHSTDMLEKKCSSVESFVDDDFNDCNCGFEESNVFPSNPMLAQSYVPIQYMDRTFKPNIGLKMGTIFPELVSPYCPGQSMQQIQFIESTNTIGKGCNANVR